MVLPVLGLLGLGAAGLFGSAGKAIAGGAGEAYSDLYSQDRAEKLDYLKRKRLMEESAKISRQDQKLADKEANEKARQQLENTVKKQIGTLMQNGYSRQNASMIVANGNDAYNTALNFAGNLKPVDGVLPDPDTFYTTYTGDVALSGKDQEKINAISKGEWTEMAVNSLDANYVGSAVSPYRIVMTKKPTDKDQKTTVSTANILGAFTQSLINAKSLEKTDDHYNKQFGLNESIDLKFDNLGQPADEATKKVIDNLNSRINMVRDIIGKNNKDKDWEQTPVKQSIIATAFENPLKLQIDRYEAGTSNIDQFTGFATTHVFKDDTASEIVNSLTAMYDVYESVSSIYYGRGDSNRGALEITKAPNFKQRYSQLENNIQFFGSMYLNKQKDQSLIRQESSIAGSNVEKRTKLREFVTNNDQLNSGTIIKDVDGTPVGIILANGALIDLIE
jgi:hypothetical protein